MQEQPSAFHISLSVSEMRSAYIFVCVTCSVVSDSLQPQTVAARLLCPWDSPGKNTGVGLPFPSLGDLPSPGIKLGSPASQEDSLPSEPAGKAKLLKFTWKGLEKNTKMIVLLIL